MQKISFEKATLSHEKVIFDWLKESHIVEFWDNSQEHKDDILNFIYGKQQHYFDATFQYFVGFIYDEPYCFVVADEIKDASDLLVLWRENLSKCGATTCLDFCIGNKKYLEKGLASITLEKFVQFYKKYVNCCADTFSIDPDENNPKAQHVYEKAGFTKIGNFKPEEGAFIGRTNFLMVKQI